MSGLAAVLDPRATASDIERMLKAAPHRGEPGAILIGASGVCGVQNLEAADSYAAAGSFQGGGLTVVAAGCVEDGSTAVVGMNAAKAIGNAYLRSGPSGVERLAGACAAVILDHRRGRAVAVRGPVGERSLHWREGIEGPAFASEIKQLAELEGPPPEIDVDALLNAATGWPEHPGETIYRGVRRVAPGTMVIAEADRRRVRRYWDPRRIIATGGGTFDDTVEAFRAAMIRAVERRLRNPSAILLSGGVDSSVVAAAGASLHRERFGIPLRAVTGMFPGSPAAVEAGLVRRTSEHLNIDVLWTEPAVRLFSDIDDAAWLHDGLETPPLVSQLTQLLRRVREHRISVALTGHAGDVVLEAMPWMVPALFQRARLRTLLLLHARHPFDRHGPIRTLKRAAAGLWRSLPGPWVESIAASQIPTWIEGGLRERFLRPQPWAWREQVVRIVELWLAPSLETMERLSLSEGVVLTDPFADPAVFDVALSAAPELHVRSGIPKAIARHAFPELPDEVRFRVEKTNYRAVLESAPVQDGLRELLRGPRLLPGVDWGRLETALREGLPSLPERRLVRNVLVADRILGRA